MLARRSRCFEFYITKKVFCFFVAKTRKTQLYTTKNIFWFVCYNIGLFSVLLHQKMVFFRYAGGHADFHLILLKQRFSFLLAKLHCLRIVFLRTNLFSVSITKLHFRRSLLPKKCFDLLATELGYLQPYVTKKSVSFFLCLKYAGFSSIAGKTCFGLFSVKNWAVSSVITPLKFFVQACWQHNQVSLSLTSQKRAFLPYCVLNTLH